MQQAQVVVVVLTVETVVLLQLFTAAQTHSAGLKTRPGAECADSDRTPHQHITDSQKKKEKETGTFSCLQKFHLNVFRFFFGHKKCKYQIIVAHY